MGDGVMGDTMLQVGTTQRPRYDSGVGGGVACGQGRGLFALWHTGPWNLGVRGFEGPLVQPPPKTGSSVLPQGDLLLLMCPQSHPSPGISLHPG